MTHYPNSIEVSKVAKTFERLAAVYPDGRVDMDAVHITHRNDDEHCVACMAGWFVVGTFDETDDITWESAPDSDIERKFFDVRAYARWSATGEDIRFMCGANHLATQLGFATPDDVEAFFASRPWLWGNDAGACLFCEPHAFGVTSGDTLTLDDLADHWRGVAERIRQIEEKMMYSGRSFDKVGSESNLAEAA